MNSKIYLDGMLMPASADALLQMRDDSARTSSHKSVRSEQQLSCLPDWLKSSPTDNP